MLLKDLQSIGFTKNLAEVYLSLAQLGGQAKAGEIIKKTSLHRNIVYICLDKLIEKKLVTKIEERGVKVYKTLDSARLMNEIRTKELLAINIIEEIEALKKHPTTQEVTVYEGLEGFRNYNMLTLERIEEGGTLQVLGSIGDKWFEYMGQEKYKQYIKLQNKKKIKWEMVTYIDSKRDKQFIKDYPDLCEIKLLPQKYNNPASIYIYNDTISINIFTEPFSVIEIKNNSVAEVYKNYFNILWNQEVKTYNGWKEIEKLFFEELLPSQKIGDQLYCSGGGYGASGEDKKVEDFYLKYNSIRIKNEVTLNILFYEHHREKAQKEFIEAGDPEFKYTNTKFLPASYYSSLQIHLMSGKTIIVTWGEEPLATVYEQKDIYDSFKKQFDLLWNQEVQTYRGWKEIDQIFRSNLTDGYTHDVYGANYSEGTEEDHENALNFYIEYHKKTSYLKPKKRLIFFERDITVADKEITPLDPNAQKNIQLRFLPDKYFTPVETHVFKDKVILLFSFGEPIATVYTNPKIIETYRRQFDFWWEISTK